MRLLDLRLDAFGPFSDSRLDLSRGAEGLHVIFGPNEAGKSSALRALNGFLYGIPPRTSDDFHHRGHRELRVGARLRGANGRELVCYRRKGSKRTLLTEANEPLAEDALAAFLGGVGRELFERRYGIDHATLVEGGRMLLEGHGEEAEALFGASLGGTNVRAVLAGLDQEARELFAPQASKPALNALIRRHDELQKKLREASLSASHWQAAERAASKAREDLEQAAVELTGVSRQRARLERLRRTLPNLRRREQLMAELAALADAPRLPADFEALRQQAVTERRDAQRGIEREQARLQELHRRRAALEVSEPLLAKAEALASLHQRLGSHRKASLDRPRLEAERATLLQQAELRYASVRPGAGLAAADELAAALARRRRAAELHAQQQALAQRVAAARQNLALRGQRWEEQRRALEATPEAPELGALRRALAEARKCGDLDSAVAEAEAAHSRHQLLCARELAALGRWSGDLQALAAAALPLAATVNRFDDRYQALAERQRGLERELEGARATVQAASAAVATIQGAGAVPGEADLAQARERRERGWRLLRRQWLEGGEVAAEAAAYDPERSLPEAFEAATAVADEVADRLRREARRVHQLAAERARLEAAEGVAAEQAAKLSELADERERVEAEWLALWSAAGVVPLSPREMREWLAGAGRLREKAAEAEGQRAALERQLRERALQRESLLAALAATPGTPAASVPAPALAPLLAQAEDALGRLDEAARRRAASVQAVAALEEEIRDLRIESESAGAAFEQWQRDWAALTAALGLGGDASPAEVEAFLEAAQEVTRLLDEAGELAQRIAGIERDAEQFQADTEAVVGEVAAELASLPADAAVEQLNARLGEQRERKAEQKALQKDIRKAEQALRDAQLTLAAAEETLAALCRQAGVADPEALEGVERRSRERQELERRLREVEEELLAGADGLAIDALRREAAGADPDAVAAELSGLAARIESQLQPRQQALAAHQANADRDLAEMSGRGTAAELAEEAQQVLAAIRAGAETYLRLRLARQMLQEEMERFRREHRGPILARASDYFARLSCASFAGVESDFDDKDQPVLLGVRPNGERVRVEGMSTGTRDQLYLALRLASLEHSLERAEALPLVVDDILIQFDDQRARATLEALAELSRKSQVILFTHHARVAEQAEALRAGGADVYLHRL